MAFCSNCGAEVFGKFCSKCGNNCGNEQDLVKTQENQNQENIKETINKLYTLRAGISCAVQKKEDYEKSRKGIKASIDKTEKQLKAMKGELFDNKGFILSRKMISAEKPSDKLRKLDERIYQYEKEAKKYNKIAIILYVMAGIFAVFGVFNMLGGAELIIGDLVNSFGPFPILIPCTIATVICGGLALLKFTAKKDQALNDASNLKNGEYKKVLKEISIASNAKTDISYAENSIKQIESQIVNWNNKLAKDNERLKTEPIPHLICANGIYDVLVKEYSKLIDTRDWANLDLVIFYFETGRARSMQEALQLVDRQRQNDRIVEAINEASYQICNTINAGIQHLQNVVVGCAKVLSTQLDEIASQQRALGREISNLQISASSMEKALKAKSNVSSNQLAEDIHQMRIYAENEAIRKRNS
ncbi:MAG: zinc ribbon domain-containing protein [Clostridia bacterium]|nr:zinc ribbon domain-containing protein [Clostridia bacterium]